MGVEDFGDHLQPAMQEIGPAVLHLKRAAGRLRAGLVQENQIAAIVEVPGVSPLWKEGRIGHRRAGRVLAEAGRVDDQRAGAERSERSVVVALIRCEDIVNRNVGGEFAMDAPDLLEARQIAVGNHDA